jgi:NAD(P)-dependent dehydrogenase (short-subunit alcohol dehydrogenase family)
MPAYRISKAGINALTVSLDRTYGSEGLVANSADPGWVATELGGSEAPRDPGKGAETPVWLARFAPEAPSGLFWKDREVIDF